LHHFLKITSHKEVTEKFSYNVYLMMEGSGSVPLTDPDPGGPKKKGPKTEGSGSATLVSSEPAKQHRTVQGFPKRHVSRNEIVTLLKERRITYLYFSSAYF
jgi:hypothetical protein